jgi:hypothetical protein
MRSSPATPTDEADVMQLCIEGVGSYKEPGKALVRDKPVPETPVGKIRRRDLCGR